MCLLTACGGKLDTDLDGGADANGDDASCTAIAFSSQPPNPGGSCDAVGSWSCGTTQYSVECSCGIMEADPKCTCTTVTGTVSNVTTNAQAN